MTLLQSSTRFGGIFMAAGMAAFLLTSCNQVDYQPVPPDLVVLTVNHLGAYSSQMGDDETEVQGTMFQTTWKLIWQKQGDGWLVQRRLDSMDARGYHKNSMPNELEKKADLDITLGSDGIPRSITGYDSLHAVLSRISQADDYREALLRSSDTTVFQAIIRDVFRLRNMLPKGILKPKMALDISGVNSHLETLKLDSAVYQGTLSRQSLECLEYDAYYHRTDSLPLLVEQFFYSSVPHRKWKHSTWDPGEVDGIWHFSLDGKTGLPCFESLSETGHIVLKDTAQKAEQPITLYRYEEDLYDRAR